MHSDCLPNLVFEDSGIVVASLILAKQISEVFKFNAIGSVLMFESFAPLKNSTVHN
jgi:hypothetical protein